MVNLNGADGGPQYLQVEIQLMTRDPVALSDLERHAPAIRARLLMLLAQQDAQGIADRAGKERLQAQALAEVRKLKPDVVFSPMQTMGSWGRDYGLVLTLHDLIYYENRTPPRDLPAFVRGLWRLYHLAWWPQRMLLNRADAIVTVSETSAGLIRRHRLTKRPLTVVHNAADELGTPDLPRTRWG